MRYILFALLFVVACSKPTSHHETEDKMAEDNPNQVLYDQVMDIHDEVMPSMGEIARLKREISEQIKNSPEMVVEKKAELEKVIANLDSASNAMMDWMHTFNPLPDSIDQETAREYLETEMEKIKKVRDLMNESIEKGKSAVGKN